MRKSPIRKSHRVTFHALRVAVEPLEQRQLLTATIASGQTIDASITRSGQLDTYTFSAAVGNSFDVSVGDATATSTYHPYFRVLAPNGTQVINGSSAEGGTHTAAINLYQVPTGGAGTYSIIVSDYTASGTGAYALEMIKMPGTIAANPDGNGGAIASGQTKTGSITRPGDLDAFTFSAAVNDSFELSVGDPTSASTYHPYFEVFAPNGNRVVNGAAAEGGSNTSASSLYQVPTAGAGTYTIIVSDYDANGTGVYALEMIKAPGSIAADSNGDGGPITSGQTKTGSINRPGDLDAFTFSAAVNDSFEVSVGDSTSASTYHPYFEVFAPNGNRVVNGAAAEGGSNTSASSLYQVPTGGAGTYTIIVLDYAPNGTGAYAVEMVKVPGPLAADSNGDGGPITSGQTLSELINRPGDLDAFTFSASVNDAFDVSVGDTTPTSTYHPYFQLFAPNGNRVINGSSAEGGINTSVVVPYKVPTGGAGTYTILVSDYDANGTGAYTLELTGNIHPTTPTITVTPPASQTATAGVAKSFSLGSFAESNATGPYTVDVSWGDGTADTKFSVSAAGSIPAKSHTYAKVGTDTAGIVITDAKTNTSKKVTFGVTVVAPTTASISGTVFNDGNANGVFDSGELGLGLWQVYIDANKDGKYDTGDTLATTDANGNWSFTKLATGTYTIRVVQLTGTATTTPSGGVLTITLAAGQTVTGKLFGEKRIA